MISLLKLSIVTFSPVICSSLADLSCSRGITFDPEIVDLVVDFQVLALQSLMSHSQVLELIICRRLHIVKPLDSLLRNMELVPDSRSVDGVLLAFHPGFLIDCIVVYDGR